MRLLKAADHRRMPWKNGAGETIEIAVHPEGAGLDVFDWRVSMASVAVDGPFSVFPGIDRTLAILDGAAMVLDIEGLGRQRLTPQTAPLAFPADAPTSARLEDGPIADLSPRVAEHFVQAELRHFDYDDLDEAVEWAAAPKGGRPASSSETLSISPDA